MIWLELMVFDDGSRVESSLPGHEDAASGDLGAPYRLRRADGTVTEFSSLAIFLKHLREHYDLGSLRRAVAAEIASQSSADARQSDSVMGQ